MKFGYFLRTLSLIALIGLAFEGKPASAEEPAGGFGLSEQGWIIFTAANELSRMAAFSADPKNIATEVEVKELPLQTGQPPSYLVTVPLAAGGTFEKTLSVTQNAWSPELYSEIAAELVSRYKLAATGRFKDDALISLTAFTAKAMMEENKQLSAYLTGQSTDPAAHQTAAVLLGTFAMRENSGWLWDPKLACCRATAHLALARALRADKSISDEDALAELLIGLIIDTKTDCARRIEDLIARGGKHRELLPWARAAALRNTRDWRLPPAAPAGTQLEKIEKFRAFGDGATLNLGIDYIKSAKPEPDPELNRIALSVDYSVEAGHIFTEKYVGMELYEIVSLLDREYPKTEDEFKSLIETLNQIPTSTVAPDQDGKNVIQVIDRGMWCLSAQRHICNAIYQTWYFMENNWGVHDEAAKFWNSMDQYFASLRLYPIIAFPKAEKMNEPMPFAYRLQALFVDSPQDVPDNIWAQACKPKYSSLFLSIGEREKNWFTPPIPTGTAYRGGGRLGTLPQLTEINPALMEPLYRIAPVQENIAYYYYKAKYPNQTDPRAFEQVIGPLGEYAYRSIYRWSKMAANDSAIEEKTLLRITAFNPDAFDLLGNFYVKHNEPLKARDAYQAMVDKAYDQVGVANSVGWIVNYYFENGEKEKALEIAQRAAEVYSGPGLATYAALQEKMGNLDVAEEYFRKIEERYNNSSELLYFYSRQAGHDPSSKYAARERELAARMAPKETTKVSLADFNGAPSKGVLIMGEGPGLAPNGLKVGDIIVALDGFKVDTMVAYTAVRGLKQDPEMALIIFRDGNYLEIAAKAENRRLGCPIKNWLKP